jgi:hypothetical protein
MHSTRLERALLDLRSAGYDVVFRRHGWTECLVFHADERWLGRGVTDDDALDDALHQMLPSRLARDARGEAGSTRLAVATAVATLDALLARIGAELPSLAKRSAERQRLQMQVWVCRARAAEEALPGVRQVSVRVQTILHRVAAISRMLWPGSVRALRLEIAPAEAMDREVVGAPPKTWAEAAERAEQRLRERARNGPAEGLDEDGWIDSSAGIAAQANPDALLAQAAAELDAMLLPADDALPATHDLAVIVRIARMVRAVRTSVQDPIAWGRVMGRLRRLRLPPGPRRTELQNTLDPARKPVAPWSASIANMPVDAARREMAAKLLDELAELGPGEDSMSAWLRRAFPVVPLPDLAERLRPRRAQVAAVAERATAYEDRRDRRKLRDLVELLDAGDVEDAPVSGVREIRSSHEEEDEDEAASEIGEESGLQKLCDGLRPRTRGHRVLLVGNRSDDKLEARLAELLGIRVTTCDGSPRRLQAQCERIARGSYDLVLIATSFQSHSTDDTLARATRAAAIPYVRVKRGRLLACVLAIGPALDGAAAIRRATPGRARRA